MKLTYGPGAMTLVSTGDATALIAVDPSDIEIEKVWETLVQLAARSAPGEDRVSDLLDGLTTAYGLRNLPHFAIVGGGSEAMTLAVRGTIEVHVDGEPATVARASGAPWTVIQVHAVDRIEVGGVNSPSLPLIGGVVGAGGCSITASVDGLPVRAPMPAAAVVTAPEPEPEPAPEPLSAESGYTALFQRRGKTAEEKPSELAAPEPTQEPTPAPVSSRTQVPTDGTLSGEQGWATEAPPTTPTPMPLLTPTPGGLIDGIPGFGAAPTPPAPAPQPQPSPRSTQPTAPRGDEAEATLSRASLGSRGAQVPEVLALNCPAGHLSPPHAAECRICGLTIGDHSPVRRPRPSLGRLRLPAGEVLDLDRDAIFGRAPHEPKDSPSRHHLINVSAYGPHLSRMHLEVVLDDWFVMVRDLGSTEGTIVTLPGQSPERLRAHELLALVPGAHVSLAGDYEFTYEVRP